MASTEDNSNTDLSGYLDSSFAEGGVIPLPDLIRHAFEEGRAAALQGLSGSACPYFAEYRFDRSKAWNDGFRSYFLSKN